MNAIKLTRAEWSRRHRDVKGYINGLPFLLVRGHDGGATLTPVELVEAVTPAECDHPSLDVVSGGYRAVRARCTNCGAEGPPVAVTSGSAAFRRFLLAFPRSNGEGPFPCPACDGEGEVARPYIGERNIYNGYPPDWEGELERCEACGGDGEDRCHTCGEHVAAVAVDGERFCPYCYALEIRNVG